MATKVEQLEIQLRCLDKRYSEALKIDKRKVLIGSSEACDIKLHEDFISSYHALIYIKDNEGLLIKDLFSHAGIFVNGQRIQDGFIGHGDILSFGNLSFTVEIIGEDVEILADDDSHLQVVVSDVAPEIPEEEGLVFIDGDFCNIIFDESNFTPLSTLPELMDAKSLESYVELETGQEAFDVVHNISDKRLEVITYMNGLILDMSYLTLKNGDYFLGKDIPFHSIQDECFFTVSDGELSFRNVNGLVAPSSVNLDEATFFTAGAEQISLRLVNKAITVGHIPFLSRDKEFYKQSGKVFASVFLPMLLLLFFVKDKPEEIKDDVAIIYTIPSPITQETQKKSEVAATEITSQTENTGHKETQQTPEKVQHSQASAKQKVAAKNASPQDSAAPKAPEVKAYEFNSSIAMGSLTADAPSLKDSGVSRAKLNDTTFNTGSENDGVMVAGADVGVSKLNGSDKSGSGSASFGSRGLASKAGFDSSYLEPKTVVLGSMDPELLRRILREYIPQFRHCYQQELISNSDKIKGVIDLNFTIGPQGKVAKHNIKAKDARFSSKGIGCMGQVLGLIDFPKPKGGGVVDVRQPLNFFAESEKI
ncbi:MAG: FHA domain-containing protein [Bacteriovoracaceae bacterium]